MKSYIVINLCVCVYILDWRDYEVSLFRWPFDGRKGMWKIRIKISFKRYGSFNRIGVLRNLELLIRAEKMQTLCCYTLKVYESSFAGISCWGINVSFGQESPVKSEEKLILKLPFRLAAMSIKISFTKVPVCLFHFVGGSFQAVYTGQTFLF